MIVSVSGWAPCAPFRSGQTGCSPACAAFEAGRGFNQATTDLPALPVTQTGNRLFKARRWGLDRFAEDGRCARPLWHHARRRAVNCLAETSQDGSMTKAWTRDNSASTLHRNVGHFDQSGHSPDEACPPGFCVQGCATCPPLGLPAWVNGIGQKGRGVGKLPTLLLCARKRSPPCVIYCTVLARSAKLPTPPWPPAIRSIWMPIFWTPFTSAVVPGLAGGICGAGLQMSVTKPSFASGM
jgi:hypothetical protein